MQDLLKRAGAVLRRCFEIAWSYMGSMGAMCLFVAALGLGVYHAMLAKNAPYYACYAGVYNAAGAVPPDGITALGRGASPGVPHVRLEYDESGRVACMKSMDAAGRLCELPGSRVAEQRLVYDAAGQLVRKENFGANGAPAEDAQGVARREYERDSAGRVVRTRFCNAAGAPAQPRFPGYAECRVRYDAQGRPLELAYLDAAGAPVCNAAGEERVEYSYEDDGSMTRSNYVAGKLADNYAGVAQELLRSCEQGTCRSWLNAAGQPVVHPAVGAAALHHDSGVPGGVECRRFMDADGSPCDAVRACAEHMVQCNRSGQLEWECYGGANGLPVNHPSLGYAERMCTYSPEGRLLREYYWDAQGQPAPIHERRHVQSHAGVYTLTLHADGSTAVQPE